MDEVSLNLSQSAHQQLLELSGWLSLPPQVVLERLIKRQYDQQFWAAVDAGYRELRADATEWAEVEAERSLWENTLADGLSVDGASETEPLPNQPEAGVPA